MVCKFGENGSGAESDFGVEVAEVDCSPPNSTGTFKFVTIPLPGNVLRPPPKELAPPPVVVDTGDVEGGVRMNGVAIIPMRLCCIDALFPIPKDPPSCAWRYRPGPAR